MVLHDALAVSRECLKFVHKKAKRENAVASTFALTDGQLTAMLQEGTEDEKILFSGAGRGKPLTRKPQGWKPNLTTEFCAGCPHADKSECWSDPRKVPTLPDAVLKNHQQYDRTDTPCAVWHNSRPHRRLWTNPAVLDIYILRSPRSVTQMCCPGSRLRSPAICRNLAC